MIFFEHTLRVEHDNKEIEEEEEEATPRLDMKMSLELLMTFRNMEDGKLFPCKFYSSRW